MENTKMTKENLIRLKSINHNTAVLSCLSIMQAALMIQLSSPWLAVLCAGVGLMTMREYFLGRDILKKLEANEKP